MGRARWPLLSVAEESFDVEAVREHGDFPIVGVGPLFSWAIPVQFHPVFIGVPKVKRLADSVVGCAIQRDPRGD